MKLAIWAIGAVLAFSGVVFWVMTHPNRDRAIHMEEQLTELKKQNENLAAKNRDLTRDVEALRNDPNVAARRAREVGPFAAPNETVVQFKQPKRDRRVEVVVQVTEKDVTIAGSKHAENKIENALALYRDEVRGAHFVVESQKGVSSDRVKRIQGFVNESNANSSEK